MSAREPVTEIVDLDVSGRLDGVERLLDRRVSQVERNRLPKDGSVAYIRDVPIIGGRGVKDWATVGELNRPIESLGGRCACPSDACRGESCLHTIAHARSPVSEVNVSDALR